MNLIFWRTWHLGKMTKRCLVRDNQESKDTSYVKFQPWERERQYLSFDKIAKILLSIMSSFVDEMPSTSRHDQIKEEEIHSPGLSISGWTNVIDKRLPVNERCLHSYLLRGPFAPLPSLHFRGKAFIGLFPPLTLFNINTISIWKFCHKN